MTTGVNALVREASLVTEPMQSPESRLHELEQLAQAQARRLGELERRVETQDLRIREQRHRVKNDLQIIMAMLHLQQDGESLEVRLALDAAYQRVGAIARLYEQMVAPDEAHVTDAKAQLLELVRSSRLLAPAGVTIAADFDSRPWLLPAGDGASVTIIAHELVTNALKHAFPTGSGGRVTVVLEHVGTCDTLSVADDGVGTGAGGATLHLGRRIVRALTQQLGGTLREVPQERGTRLDLVIPRRS